MPPDDPEAVAALVAANPGLQPPHICSAGDALGIVSRARIEVTRG